MLATERLSSQTRTVTDGCLFWASEGIELAAYKLLKQALVQTTAPGAGVVINCNDS